MPLLIRYFLRRNQRATVTMVLAVGAGWFWVATEPQVAQLVFAFSPGMAYLLGPELRLWLLPRAIWYLPVRQRDVWRAGWLVSTVGITALFLAAKLPGFFFTSARETIGASGLLLSVAYDFASTGIGAALVVLVTSPGPARGPLHVAWPAVQGTAGALLPVGVLPFMYLPQWLDNAPPVQWDALSARAGAALAAGVALGIVTYFHSPTPAVLANRVGRRTRSVRGGSWIGLTGVPRLLLHEYAWTLGLGGGLGLAVTVFIVFMSGSIDMRTLLENPAVNLLFCYLGLVAPLMARFSGMLRHLRVLPLGAARLTALLLAWPAIILVTMWMAFAIVRYLALGDAPSSHQALTLAGLIGVSALVQAGLLWFTSAIRAVVFGVLMMAIPLVQTFAPLPAPALASVGLGGLLAAAFINYAALSRSSTYKAGVNLFVPVPAAR